MKQLFIPTSYREPVNLGEIQAREMLRKLDREREARERKYTKKTAYEAKQEGKRKCVRCKEWFDKEQAIQNYYIVHTNKNGYKQSARYCMECARHLGRVDESA
jgi:hypothetical protein